MKYRFIESDIPDSEIANIKLFDTQPPNTEIIDMVQASTVLAVNVVKDIGTDFISFTGGEMKAYSEMIKQSVMITAKKLKAEAAKLNADGICGIRITHPSIAQQAAEVNMYGYAFKFKKR